MIAKRLFVWGFCGEMANVVQRVRQHDDVEVVHWVGDSSDATVDYLKFRRDPNEVAQLSFSRKSRNAYDGIFEQVFALFSLMHLRPSKRYLTQPTYHDLIDQFCLYYDYFASVLTTEKITHVVFSNLPHEGPDIVLYTMARQLGIKTLLMNQSIFPNRFFYVTDLEDFGKFENNRCLEDPAPFKLPKKHEKDLPYMASASKDVNRLTVNNNPMNGLFPVKYFRRIVKNLISICTAPKSWYRKYRKANRDRRLLPHLSTKAWGDFRNQLSMSITTEIDVKKPFVYFPLHLQPELSTSAIGGKYWDQIRAIEDLSSTLPENWRVFVKENPKQTPYARSERFFSRLNRIENVDIVPSEMDSIELIKSSKFVATITGTAGWEAISGGKPAVVFGNPWYKTLPGAFPFCLNLDCEKIANEQICHQEIELGLGEIISKCPKGVVDPASYSSVVKGFDSEKNSAVIASFIHNILQE